MSKMTPEVKAALRAASEAKRKANPKAKDYAPGDWLVACDHAEEAGLMYEEDFFAIPRLGKVAFLRYVPSAVIDALKKRLPWRATWVSGYPQSREVALFKRDLIEHVLTFLHLPAVRYRRYLKRSDPESYCGGSTDTLFRSNP